MAYNVKLKNQLGTEVTYSSIETVAVPLASGTGSANFAAQYSVNKNDGTNIAYDGGTSAAYGVDYMCRIYIPSGVTGYKLPESITIKIDSATATAGVGYTYTKLSNTESYVKILGNKITGNITMVASAVKSS